MIIREALCEGWLSLQDCVDCSMTECGHNPNNLKWFAGYIKFELGVDIGIDETEEIYNERLRKLYRALKPYMANLMSKVYRLLSYDNFVDSNIPAKNLVTIIEIDDWFEIAVYVSDIVI